MRVKPRPMEIGVRTRKDGIFEARVQIHGKRFSGYGRTKDAALPTVVLAGLLGLRIGEIQGLRAHHFADARRLVVPGTKTGAAARTLPLPPRVLALIAGLPFPLAAASRSSAWKALASIAPSVGPHLLRHSFNTGLRNIGCPFEIRASIMGHALRHVQDIYLHDGVETLQLEWLTKWSDTVLSTPDLGTEWGKSGSQ